VDLQTNVFRIEMLHQFDLQDASDLIRVLKEELKLLRDVRPASLSRESESKIEARTKWLESMIAVLESGLSSRIEIVSKLEEKCKIASELLNDAEFRVFMTSLNNTKTAKQIADEVGYAEGYVNNLISSIKKKTGIMVVKL